MGVTVAASQRASAAAVGCAALVAPVAKRGGEGEIRRAARGQRHACGVARLCIAPTTQRGRTAGEVHARSVFGLRAVGVRLLHGGRCVGRGPRAAWLWVRGYAARQGNRQACRCVAWGQRARGGAAGQREWLPAVAVALGADRCSPHCTSYPSIQLAYTLSILLYSNAQYISDV
eukprot:6188558-Pleurochrysis_carterae.AAC.1